MEPELIRNQVKCLSGAIAANAVRITSKHLNIEDAFVDHSFVLTHAAALHDAVADSVSLQQTAGREHHFVISSAEFCAQQVKALQVVVEDGTRLQDENQTTHKGLGSLCDTFNLGLVTNLRDVLNDNATVALQRQIPPNALLMSNPQFVARLSTSLHSVLVTLVGRTRKIASLQEICQAAERTSVAAKAQIEELYAGKAASAAKIAELEASLAVQQQTSRMLMTAVQEAADSAQKRISKLEEEMVSLNLERSVTQEDSAELTKLQEEFKTLVKENEDQRIVVAQTAQRTRALATENEGLLADRVRLSKELSEIQRASQHFSLDRAREHESMIAEIAKLGGELRESKTQAGDLAAENTQLKADVARMDTELTNVRSQLEATETQSDTWKATLAGMKVRHAAELAEVQKAIAPEQSTSETLLRNAAKRIEDMESQLRGRNQEVEDLQKALKAVNHPVAPAPSSSSKRSLADADQASVQASSSRTPASLLDFSAHASPMPPERVQDLDALPSVSVDLGPGDGAPAIFTRKSLSSILGGSIQGLVVRCTDSASKLAQKHGIQDYLCPNLDHNAWSPTGPGKHGYMQVGLGRDSKRFNEGDFRHVFVGAGSHLQYCGWYRVLRVQPLTKEEWATLPQKVKETYSETTVKKEKSTLSSMSKEQVLAMYNSGELRAPCARLQCIAFDTAFYQELVRANDKFFEGKPPVLLPSAGPSARAPKRRKVAGATANPKEHSDESGKEVSLALALASKSAAHTLAADDPSPSSATVRSSLHAAERPQAEATDVSQGVPQLPVSQGVSQLPTPPAGLGAAPPELAWCAPRQTRSTTQKQTGLHSGTLKLRIPGGRGQQPAYDEASDDVLELTSEWDDDHMYADLSG